MLPTPARRKADVVISTLMIVFGAFIIYRASLMPWSSTRTGGESQWFLSPGLFPATIGSLLILFSCRVLLTALREGGHRGILRSLGAWVRNLPADRSTQRVAFMIVWLAIYIFGLIGNVNYLVASSLFLFVFIAVFWLPGAGRAMLSRAAIALAVAILVPLSVSYTFEHFLYVPAP
ncbi:tripartite tricarboxylate transporter TctB family protein [Acuticoccus kandeliae]|uniref:tripartite tricarboxylate transporter TctB family protein n=1 Tax=Acuticoccus kandeliae TaxID=2073160 RepID=UPI001300BA9C|nr:tripartite tricarboxylate transporter TctB family protein [Acuticoccus kandeliae]